MKYLIETEVTERTIQRVEVEAETPEEALRLVEEYEVDNSDFVETGSIHWSVDNTRLVNP